MAKSYFTSLAPSRRTIHFDMDDFAHGLRAPHDVSSHRISGHLVYRHLIALVVLIAGDQSNRPSSSGFGLACGGTITSMLPGSGR